MFRDVKEPAIAEALIRKTEQRIEEVDHPDPYICTLVYLVHYCDTFA